MLQAISYKDPEGFVIVKDKLYYRYVSLSYKDAYDHLMQSGLYQELVEKKLLIPHQEMPLTAEEELKFYKKLFPEQIGFISYPYEWSFEHWKKAVTTYLRICITALEYGMILRDATPFNLTFYKGNCVLFDTLSFGIYQENMPWTAYRQFCESMFGPLALIRYKGSEWSTMMASHINGWQLPFISKQLPPASYGNPSCLIHLHWHARFINHKKANSKQTGKKFFKKEQLSALWKMMEASVTRWKMKPEKNTWEKYYADDIESENYLSEKSDCIKKWLQKISPAMVVDIGANTGIFSFIASMYADRVIAIESDNACVDELARRIRKDSLHNIIPVLSDIAEPAPALGWDNAERISLLKRLRCDTLLALAVVHHLRIARNIPLELIARLFARITTAYLIIEFVPETDSKVQQMLQNRGNIFGDYNEANFVTCFSAYFTLCEVNGYTSSQRKLYIWLKR